MKKLLLNIKIKPILYKIGFGILFSIFLENESFGQISLTLVGSTPFTGVYYSSVAFADIDGDTDQDLIIMGMNSSYMPSTQLFKNNGSGVYSLVAGSNIVNARYGDLAFADVDGDNDMDLLITGEDGNVEITKLYKNDGNGLFTEVIGTPFVGVAGSSVTFADIDGDNDQDVLITGRNNLYNTKLYTNNGNGVFIEVLGTPFVGVFLGDASFTDVDNDNDQDVIITGSDGSQKSAKLYKNNGNGVFTEIIGSPFDPVDYSSVAFADIDGDNDKDIIITGENSSAQTSSTTLYTNNGSGAYTLVSSPFIDVYKGTVTFVDIDSDNDQDVLITGKYVTPSFNENRQAKLYTNNGSGIFTEFTGTLLAGISSGLSESSVAFAEVDGDNKKDLIVTGIDGALNIVAKLYKNNTIIGIEENDFKSDLLVYPNPTNNLLTINLGNTFKDIEIGIKNVIGKNVSSNIFTNKNEINISLNELIEGIYFVNIIADGKTAVLKILKK